MPKVIDTHRLFATTVRVFSERGYLATTTQEVARRTGASEVTLFRRWGTKAGLLEAALTHCLSETAFAQVRASDEVRADLEAIARAYTETQREYGGAVLTLLHEAGLHPELRGAFAVLRKNLANAAGIIAAHQARGALAPGEPLQKLVFLFAPLMAAGLWARAKLRQPAPAPSPEAVVEAFLHGHAAHPKHRRPPGRPRARRRRRQRRTRHS